MKKNAKPLMQHAVYIDHEKAFVMQVQEDGTLIEETLSAPEPHQHFSGETSTKTGMMGRTINRQKKMQDHENELFNKFCKSIFDKLQHSSSVLIFGPAEAKLNLKQCWTNSKMAKLAKPETAVTEKMTVEAARRFALDHYMTSAGR